MLMLRQMIVLFILMGIGYISYKKKIITDEVSKKLSAIVINIANPALVLSGCIGEEKVKGQELLTVMIVSVVMYACLLLLAYLLPLILRVNKKSRGTYGAMTVFSNIGFMGFPVISALYGNGALLYAALFVIPFNVLIYTYGISAIQAKEDDKTEVTDTKDSRNTKAKRKIDFGKILNIGVISCFLTMLIYIAGIQVPDFLKSTITHLSNLTAPLSMMVIGASLAAMNLKELFTDGKLILFSLVKLIAVPILGILLIRIFVDNEVILGVCMVMLATPVGSMTAMLAQQYGGDYETASKGVALTTVLSVATMPLIAMLL